MPRGGRRPGAGRKPKARVLQHPSSPPPVVPVALPTTNDPPPMVVDEFEAPDNLNLEERQVWTNQAPHAFKAGTLTRATALAFERYCRVVVMERNESKSSASGGPNHRGLLKQINAYELQFLLTPCGKPLAVPQAPAAQDADDDFFGGARAGGGN